MLRAKHVKGKAGEGKGGLRAKPEMHSPSTIDLRAARVARAKGQGQRDGEGEG